MQARKKALLAAVVALMLIFALAATALADDYSSHWSNSFVKDAISKGWITTDANGNIQPDAQTTRGQYALMMWKSLGSPAPTKANPFTDIGESSPYYNAVRALFEAGVTTGMSATIYGPDVNLNREMACTMLVRAHKLTPANASAYQQFADHAQISDWARNALSVMAESKYVEGIGNNMFAPKQNLKNGEMIKIVMNVANGVNTAASAAAQQQAAAIVAVVQQQNSSSMKLSYNIRVMDSSEATIELTVSDSESTIKTVSWKKCAKGDTFENDSTFSKLSGTANPNFTVTENSWYAVCATSNRGGFIYKTFEITGLTPTTDAPLPKLTRGSVSSGKLPIDVEITGSIGIDKVVFVSDVDEKTTYTSLPSGTDITLSNRKGTFNATTNELYAVIVKYTSGKIAYTKINVTNLNATNAPAITTSSLAGGTVNTAYSQTLTATGAATITWSIASGNLPTGLNLNTSTGVISGTPTTAGTYNFTVKASNSIGDDSKALSIVVAAAASTVSVTSVSVSPITASVAVGANTTITATVAPANATNKSVTWSSSDTSKATVSNNGVVTGVAPGGPITITATTADGGKTATCAVTVTPAASTAVTGVTLNKNATTINVGANETLTATVAPAGATNKNVTWTTSNGAVATVDNSGMVSAVAAGTATITVKTVDGNFTATCTVDVPAVLVTSVTVSGAGGVTTVAVGSTLQLTAAVTPATATNQTVTWSSSNDSFATVDSNGLVTGVAAGSAIITAFATDGSGVSGAYPVNVTPVIP